MLRLRVKRMGDAAALEICSGMAHGPDWFGFRRRMFCGHWSEQYAEDLTQIVTIRNVYMFDYLWCINPAFANQS